MKKKCKKNTKEKGEEERTSERVGFEGRKLKIIGGLKLVQKEIQLL